MYCYSYQSLDGLYSLIFSSDASNQLLQARYFPCDAQGKLRAEDFAGLDKGHGEYLKMSICASPARSLWTHVIVEGTASSDVAQMAKNHIKKAFNAAVEEYELAVLNPEEGALLPPKSTHIEREFVIAGAHKQSFLDYQNQLIALKIYPQTLELSPPAQVGALISFARVQEISSPIMMVEMDKNHVWLTVVRRGKVEYTRTITRGIRAWILELELEQEGVEEGALWEALHQGNLQKEVASHTWVQRFVKDIRDSVGLYEVQSGHVVDSIWMSPLGEQLDWLVEVLLNALAIRPFEPDFKKWFASRGIEATSNVDLNRLGRGWLAACGLINFSSKTIGGSHA